jgi:4a-hydroxytetrahydrobiopterin dehydratase
MATLTGLVSLRRFGPRLDTAHAGTSAPVWAALLTGSTEARGRGTIGHDVRDATGPMPMVWFQDIDEHETPR